MNKHETFSASGDTPSGGSVVSGVSTPANQLCRETKFLSRALTHPTACRRFVKSPHEIRRLGPRLFRQSEPKPLATN